MKKIFALGLLVLSSMSVAEPIDPLPPRPRVKNFVRPMLDGVRLDWCQYWASNCGQPAADAFCMDKGYENAISFSIDPDIGYTKLPTGQICDGDFCDGFKSIRCIINF